MVVATRRRTRVVIVLLLALLAAATVEGLRYARIRQWNAAIRAGVLPEPSPGMPAEVRFAKAYALAASGEPEKALSQYRALQADPRLSQAARYNSANLLMRQALAVRATNQPGQAIPLIELAKETYREVLRNDPSHWDARYNLERAQRLLADADESEAPPAETPRGAERAATTMRGYSAGLP